MEIFAASFIALYAAHHVGDYWVQTDHQAKHKGLPGWVGRLNCLVHVSTYLSTQVVFLAAVDIMLGTAMDPSSWRMLLVLGISGVTHYLADRREYGLMFKLARLLPGKSDFLRLGMPYTRTVIGVDGEIVGKVQSNPTLGTGAWALDQSWHIVLGCFVPALILAA